MSIIKVELRLQELSKVIEAFKTNRRGALETFSRELKRAVATSFNELMQAEIDLFLGSADQISNKKNGYHEEREYALKGLGGIYSIKDRVELAASRNRLWCF